MRKPLFVLVALAAVVALVAAAAQAGTRTAKVTNVSVAGWSSGPDEDALVQQMIAAFNKSHPAIHATFNVINGDYPTAMTARFAAHNPPDVFYVDSSVAPGWSSQGVLQPLNGFVKKTHFNTKAFYPNLLRAFTTGKTIYGFPKDWSPLAMEIQDVALAKVGGKKAVPHNWAQLRALAVKMKAAGTAHNKPICLSPDWARLLAFVYQNGGSISKITSKATAQAVNFYVGLIKSGLAYTPPSGSWCGQELGEGNADIIFEGNWLLPFMSSTYSPTKYGVYPMVKEKTGGNLAFTVSWSMAKSSHVKSAAWTVLSWLVGKQGEKLWMSKGLALSPRTDVATIGGRKPFLAAAPYVHGWGFNNFSKAYTIMNNDLNAVISGQKSVATMLADAKRAIKG